MKLNITWQPTDDGNYPAYTGLDEQGNRYFMPGNQETVNVTLADGRQGCGWTAEQAFQIAMARPPKLPTLEDLYKAACWLHCKAQSPWNHAEVMRYDGMANGLGMALRAKGLNDLQLRQMEDDAIALGKLGRWDHTFDVVGASDGTVPHED